MICIPVQSQTLISNPSNAQFCQGSPGVQLLIINSQNGVTYNLRRQGQPGNLATVTGNGNAVTFPGNYQTGTYLTVPNTNTVNVTMAAIPSLFIVTATNNGSYCNYPGAAGVEFIAQPTQSGVNYFLIRGVDTLSTIAGTGGPINFGYHSIPGVYRVVAVNVTGCSRTSNLITVVPRTPPSANFHSDHDTPPYVCASTAVNFTSTSTGNNLNYYWNFHDLRSYGNNTSTIVNPSHIFEAYGNNTQTFGVFLRVTDSYGCIDTITKPITVLQKPDDSLHENLWLPNSNFPNTFAACNASSQNPIGTFQFTNGSTTQATNTWYHIDWGDPSIPDFNQATFNNAIDITYTSLGYTTLTYTINGQNGCNNTRLYNVFVGNFAGGGLGNPGSTAGTAEFCISFPIQPESYDNPPGTLFNFDWGDGTTQTIAREDLPVNGIIEHCYTTCSTIQQGNPPKYGFLASCNAENPCGSITTSVWPIVVSCKVQGGFGVGGSASGGGALGGNGLWGGNSADTLVGCSDVTFTDSTQVGFYIQPPDYTSYTTNTVYSWNFGDPSSGINNISSLPSPTHHFTTSGMWYTVTLIVYTGYSGIFNSGYDTVVKQIYIQSEPLADFDVIVNSTCTPVQAQFTDNSTVGGWGLPERRWRVKPNAGWEIITPGHEEDSTYTDPLFQFNAAGTYTISLLIENSCGLSQKDTSILVCELPQISIQDTAIYLCEPGIHHFVPVHNMNCDSTTVSYLWHITPSTYSFPGGSSASSKHPDINFLDYDDYLVTAIITNSCGSDSVSQVVHVTQAITGNIISPFNPSSGEICQGQSPVVIQGPIPTGGSGSYTYQWQQNLDCDLGPNGTWTNIAVGGTTQNLTIPNPLTSTRCFRRNAYDNGDCSSISNVAQILVYPVISNNIISSDQQICSGTTPGLITGTPAFGGTGTITYEWEQSADGINYSIISDETGQNYQAGSLTVSTYFRRIALSAPCSPDYSSPVFIIVCDGIGNNTITSGATICQGTQPALLTGSNPTGACGAYNYQWQISTVAAYPNYTNIVGANTANYQPPIINDITYFRRIVSTTIGNCGANTSNECVINIMPSPSANAGIDQTINNGTSTTLSGTASGGTQPFAYQWTPTNQVVPPSNQANVNTVNLVVDTEFTFTVTDANSCTASDNMWVHVTGNPLNVALTANPNTICPGAPVQICANATGGSGIYTYSWTSPGNVYPSTQCINVNPASTTIFTCVVWDNFASYTANVTVTVSPIPVITSSLAVDLCSGDQLNYSPQSTVPGTTYVWTSTSGLNCSGNTSQGQPGGTIIEDYLSNSGNDDCIVTYQITPRGPAPTYCLGIPVNLDVTTKPVSQITNPVMTQTVVAGFPTASVTFTSNVTAANIHWVYSSTSCPGYAFPQQFEGFSPFLPSQIINLSPGSPAICTLNYSIRAYVLTSAGDTCWGNPYTYQFIVNSEPIKYNLLCPLPLCNGQTATISLDNSDVGIEYRLYRDGTFVPPMMAGTGARLDWSGIGIAGSYTITATNPSNGQSTLMNGMCQVIVNPLPQIFLLTSQNNAHCSPVTIMLSGSEAGIHYQLILNGNINNPVQTLTGTGQPGFLVFNPVVEEGIYTVHAVNILTGCERDMQGDVLVDPLIQQFAIYPGGILCEGVELCVDGSEPGINYQLWLNNQPFGDVVPGDPTGGAICFGTITNAGVYRIHAENPANNCEIFFEDTAVINPLPNAYVIAPIEGCPGTQIVLNSCQEGVNYYLDFTSNKGPAGKAAIVAGPMTCTNGSINFGPWYDEGTYRILAVDTATNCSSWMNGITTIHSQPEAYTIVPQGLTCPPVDISLDHYESNVVYFLYRNGDTLVSTDDGKDGMIDFGMQNIAGIYTVRAVFTYTGGFQCWNDMQGYVEISPEPVHYTLLPSGPLCPPAVLFLNGSDIGVTYTLWNDNYGIRQILPGNGGILNFLPQNQPGNYWVTASTSDSCSSSMTGTVTVHPNPTVYHVLPQGQGLCEPSLIGLDGADSGTTYELLHADGSSLNPPEIIIPAVSGAFWFANPQPAGSYIVKATNSFLCDTLMNGTAIIHSMPTVDAGPASDTICSPPTSFVQLSGSSSNYSFVQWSSPTDPGGANFSDPYNLNTTYTFTASDLANQQVTLKLTAYGSGICAGSQVSDSSTIYLLAPVVDAGADQTVCETMDVQLNGNVSGGSHTGVWTGGMGTFDNPTDLATVYHPSPLETGTTVTLTLTSTNSFPCPNLSDDLLINIFNTFSPGTVTSDQTICFGENPVLLASTPPTGGSGAGNFIYQWQYSTDGGLTWTDAAAGSNNLTCSPGPLFVTTMFRLQQTDTYCIPDQQVLTNSITITVHDQLMPGIIGSDQQICYGQTPIPLTGTAPAGGSGSYTYQWQYSTNNGLTWLNIMAGGNSPNLVPGSLTETTLYRLLETDAFCLPAQVVTTNVIVISVYNQLIPGNASENQIICNGQIPLPLTATIPTNGSGNYSYQWQYSTDGGVTWANVTSGGNAPIYDPGQLFVTTIFRQQQTDSYCEPDQVIYTNSVFVTVDDALIAGTATANQTICFGETPASISATIPSGGSGTYTYQWEYSTDGGTTWNNVTTGGNTITHNPGQLYITTSFRLRQTDEYCSPDQVVITNVVTITVYNALTAGTAGTDQLICHGQIPLPLNATSPGNGSGQFNYQWQFSTDAGVTWADVSAGGNSLNYSPGALTISTLYRLRVADTYCQPADVVYTNTVTINVLEQLAPGAANADQTICYGETPVVLNATQPSGGSGTYSYQWQYSVNAGLTWNNIPSGGTGLNYAPSALTTTTWYRVQQTDTYCEPDQMVITNVIVVNVFDQLVPGVASADQTICNGQLPAALTAIAPSGGSGNFNYQWQYSIDGGTNWTDIVSGGNDLVYSPGILTTTTTFRLVQYDSGCAPYQVVNTNSVTITVLSPLIAGIASADQSICYGGSAETLTATLPTGGSGNFTYQWQRMTPPGSWANIAGATTLTYSPGPLYVTTYYRLLQTDNSCLPNQQVTTNTVTIDVRVPMVDAGNNDTICGMAPYALSTATAQYAVSYSWSTSGTGVFTGQYQLHSTYYPSSGDMNSGSVVLTISITDECGNVVTDNMTLRLGQNPAAYYFYSTPTCGNKAVQFYDQSAVSNGYIKTWIWDFGDGTTETIHFPGNPNTQHLFLTPGPSYYVKLTVITSLGCSNDFQQVVTVLQAPVANFYFSNISCNNEPIQFTNASQLNGSTGLQPWSWEFGDPTTGINNYSNLMDPIHQFSDTGNFVVRLIVVNSNNCFDTISKVVHIRPAPSVEFNYEITCLNTPVYFNPDTLITNTGSISNWHWDFGDGITSNIRNTVHVYTAPGDYQVALTVVDTTGCQNTVTHQIIINPLPIAHFDAGEANCAGSAVYFNEQTSTTAGYIVEWEWDFGDGTVINIHHPDNPNAYHTYLMPGNYDVTLTVLGSDNCINAETQVITIEPKPIANFDFTGAPCEGQAVDFTDLTQGGGGGNIVEWHWNFGDPTTGVNNTSAIQNPSHIFSAPGQYTVTLISLTTNGCSDTISREIEISGKPMVDFTMQNSCQNTVIQFEPNPAVMNIPAISTWHWDFGDGGNSTLQSPPHIYATSGIFYVTLTAEDSTGCTNTITKVISIIPQPYSDFTTSQPVCNLSEVEFTSLASAPAGYITTWIWNFGDGNSVVINNTGNPNVLHVYSNYGIFFASLTVVTNDSCNNAIIKQVNVEPAPLANFAFSDDCVGNAVTFSDLSQSGTGTLSGWNWNFGDPASGAANQSSQQNPTHTFTQPGTTFNVTLIATNSSGCKDTIYKTVNLSPLPDLDFSYSASCSGDTTAFISSTYVNTGTTSSWLWNFGDGATSVEMDPLHFYGVSGTYSVSLTIEDTSGCQNTKSHEVQIDNPPVALFQPVDAQCAGEPVFFDEMSNPAGGEIISWLWDFGDGNTVVILPPASPDINHIYENAGTYNVHLTVYTSQGCEDETQQDVTISVSPAAAFTYENACEDQAVSFIGIPGTNGGPEIVTYYWNFGDPTSGINNISNLQNPLHIYQNAGTYLVTLIETNAGGCNDTLLQEVIVNPLPPMEYSWNTTCFGMPTQFTVDQTITNIATIDSYDWDFGDGTVHSNLQDPVHVYTTSGNFQVILVIEDTAGCSNSKIHEVSIFPHPEALFDHSATCLAAPVFFTDESSVAGATITAWHWDFGVGSTNNDTSNVQNPAWIYTNEGTYIVTLTVTTGAGCEDSIALPVQVFGAPMANFTHTTNCTQGAVYFQDSSYSQQGNIVQWNWEFEPYQYSNLPNPMHVYYAVDSCYDVRLIVTDNLGCMDTVVKSICVPAALSATFEYTQSCYLEQTSFSPELIAPEGDSLLFFEWNFDDYTSGIYNTSNFRNPTHVFTQPGNYQVKLWVKDIHNCIFETFKNVTILNLPSAVFTYQAGTCDSTIYFKDKSSGNESSIAYRIWDFGDGIVDTIYTPNNPDVAHYYTHTGSYEVKLTIRNLNNCEETISQFVFMPPCMNAEFLTDGEVCQNARVSFQDISYSGIAIKSWKWIFGDGDSLVYTTSQNLVYHTFMTAGTFNVAMIIGAELDGMIISDTIMHQVTVKSSPIADFLADSVCYGRTSSFYNTSSGNGTMLTNSSWIFGDLTSFEDSLSQFYLEHTYQESGQFEARLIATNSLGCHDTIIKVAMVYPNPMPDFVLNDACLNRIISLENTTSETYALIDTVKWRFTNETGYYNEIYTRDAQILLTQPGDYNVDLIVRDVHGCTDSTSKPIIIYPGPQSSFAYTDQFSNNQVYLVMNNTSTGSIMDSLRYHWYFSNNNIVAQSIAKDPEIALGDDGYYNLMLVTTNKFGCTDTATDQYLFKGLYVPNAFMPESFDNELNIFQPKGCGLKLYKIEVYDRWGKVIWASEELQDADGNVGTGDICTHPGRGWDGKLGDGYFPTGVYIWKVRAVFQNGEIWDGQNAGEDKDLSGNVFGTVLLIR